MKQNSKQNTQAQIQDQQFKQIEQELSANIMMKCSVNQCKLKQSDKSQKQQYSQYIKDYKGRRQIQREDNGVLIMNQQNIKLICLKDGLYEFPQLNNKLFLHFKCIQKIQSLDLYVNVRTLYLENNVIRKIQGLQNMKQLINLFLHNNMINQIEGLDNLHKLRNINLSNNSIFKIKNISHLRNLETFTFCNNYLKTFESMEHLGLCSQTLTNIDLSGNRIEADERVLDLMPQVKLLHLDGNPFCDGIGNYRRKTVGRLKKLLYLDDRSINEDQRLISQKFCENGKQGMKKMKQLLMIKKQEQNRQKKQQIMKNINVHRQRKIKVFQKDIKQLQEHNQKLEIYLRDQDLSDQWDSYKKSFKQNKSKIQQLQKHIDNIHLRILADK